MTFTQNFRLESSILSEFAFETEVPDVSIVSEPKHSFPSPLLTVKVLELIKEIFLESKHYDVPLSKALNNRKNSRTSTVNENKPAPEWKQKSWVENLHLNRPLLLAEPDSLDLSLTESSNLLVDFSSSCSYRMDSYMSGLETLCQTFSFGKNSGSERAAVGVPHLHSPHLHIVLEPLTLSNYHIFVSGEPVPAHIVTLCLFAFHTFSLRKESPVIYVPTLENIDEAKYISALFRSVQRLCPTPFPIRCVVVVDNIFGALNLDWIAHTLEESVAGAILLSDQCLLSWEEFSGKTIDTAEFTKQINSQVQNVCAQTGILPVASGDYAFASSRTFASIVSPENEKRFSELVQRETQEQASRGWQTVVLLNPKVASFVQPRGVSTPTTNKGSFLDFSSFLHSAPSVTRNQVNFKQLEQEFLFCLQYLALFINGKARFDYTTPTDEQTILTDANTFEHYRRQIQLNIQQQVSIQLKSGDVKTLTPEIAIELLAEVFHRICHGVGSVQVHRTLETKIAYDDAFQLLKKFLGKENSGEHFSEDAFCHFITPFIDNPGRIQRFLLADELPFVRYPNVCIDGEIIFTTNESFAPARSLCKAEFPTFRPKSFGAAGQIFDGWETRRHNMFPPDYTVIKLQKPSKIYGCNIDTAHFSGNSGQGGALLGLVITLRHNRYQEEWVSLLDPVILEENSRNYFETKQQPLVQYVRLNQYPDGGIARLELFGETFETTVIEQLQEQHDALWHEKVKEYFSLLPKETGFSADFVPPYADASLLGKPDCSLPVSSDPARILFPSLHDFGGADAAVVAGSNTQYSIPSNMLRPGRGINMGDGWETARMHVDSKDVFNLTTAVHQLYHWTVVRLNQKGSIHKIVVDTFHFKNNTPRAVAIEGTDHPHLTLENYYDPSIRWCSILPPTGLVPHEEQVFDVPSGQHDKKWTHVLVKIYPCGGLSRVRLYGPVENNASL